MIRNLILLLLMAVPFFASAQTPNIQQDTITWYATADTNMDANVSFTRPSTFVTYALSRIELVKSTKAKVFAITSTEGTWTDLSQPGTMIYHVLFHDQAGLITITRDQDGLSITLDMRQSSPDGIRNKYSIDHFTLN